MPRFLKSVALYLLMLAFPVQGFAAATMLHCGLVHQHTTKAPEPDHRPAHGHADSFAADSQNQLPAALSSDSSAYASIDEAGIFAAAGSGLALGGGTGVHDSGDHPACVAGGVVAASNLRFQPADQAIEPFASKQILNVAFVTDAPTRPPRSFLP